jgi:hypothetical protein
VLNIVIERHDAAQQGLIEPKEEVVAGCRQLLKTLMADDDVFAMTQGHGYEKGHQELCRTLRNEVLRERQPAPEDKKVDENPGKNLEK